LSSVTGSEPTLLLPPPRRASVEGLRAPRGRSEGEEELVVGIEVDGRLEDNDDDDDDDASVERLSLRLCAAPARASTAAVAARSPAIAGEGPTMVEDREREERELEEGEEEEEDESSSPISRCRRRLCCSSGQCIPKAAGLGGGRGHQPP